MAQQRKRESTGDEWEAGEGKTTTSLKKIFKKKYDNECKWE